jgi:hypothetical protein
MENTATANLLSDLSLFISGIPVLIRKAALTPIGLKKYRKSMKTNGLGTERESPQDARNERTRTWTEGPDPTLGGKAPTKILLAYILKRIENG